VTFEAGFGGASVASCARATGRMARRQAAETAAGRRLKRPL